MSVTICDRCGEDEEGCSCRPSRLSLAEQALQNDPTVRGCIDFLGHFGAPAMIGPDKGALGAALKLWPEQHLEDHLADALVDWVRVRVENKKQLSVPQAVRQYLQDRAAGLPLETAKPTLSQARIDAVAMHKQMGCRDMALAKKLVMESEADTFPEIMAETLPKLGARTR